MAIKFEDDKGEKKPAKKEIGGKTYVAEEPVQDAQAGENTLPFAKQIRPEKKGPKIKNRPAR